MTVKCVFEWKRGDVDVAMSASSAHKNYVKNDICAVFNARPEVTKIVLVRAEGPAFILMQVESGCWFDVTGAQIEKVSGAR